MTKINDSRGATITEKLTHVRKRDGRIVPFNKDKIAKAVFKAASAVGGEDEELSRELADVVMLYLKDNFGDKVPQIEEIQDVVEKVLIETGHARTAKAYILHRDKRTGLREALKIRKEVKDGTNSTDLSLLVAPITKDEIFSWDKNRITESLIKEVGLPLEIAETIAQAVEKKVLNSGIKHLSTSLIRELVDNELFETGFGKKLKKHSIIGMPIYDLDNLIRSKSKENSNITANNPEAINLAIAETTLKQYMLQEVFSQDVSEAHLKGMVHIHDLGYPRVYCSSHSLEYIKKYGLEMSNLDTASAPACHARTLTGHLNTFLASLQAYYAGALGIGYINIFYAPYVENMSYEEMKQEAQYLIFSGSQNAFSRGGQTLFLDFNIHSGVPSYLKDVPAIGSKGKYTGKTYRDYEKASQQFAIAMLDVWGAGDRYGNVFAFPKCDFHINEETFTDPEQFKVFERACEIASKNGSTYFIFDRDEVTLSACCRLRTQINDDYMIKHPESMRFCGFQNVTINIPQAAYRAGKGNISGLFDEIGKAMEIAMKAHLQKKDFIADLMSKPGYPMWEVAKLAKDGRPYIDLDKSTYIMGLIGLNEAVQYLTGKELHEDEEVFKLGLKIVSYMKLKTNELGEKCGLKITLEESPAESATRRLSEIDMREYPEAATVVKGDIDLDEHYYTNSIHFRADAPVDLVTRIEKQSKFHTLIESGAIIHAFIGEERPSKESIMELIKKTFYNTQAAQITISPEFTICNDCKKNTAGLKENCGHCQSEDVYGMTRIVGYFSQVHNWNISKKGELKDRHKGDYKF
ncbi:anaerobic ribonucleoside-triphosphate reductase [bacterium]|nr:anaerobic ribonucleoside-triphosphate reductase [bacterium]